VTGAATAEREGVAGSERGERVGRSLEGSLAPRSADQASEQGGGARHERPLPRAEHDCRREVDAGGDAEDTGPDRCTHARVLGLLEQLRGERSRAEEREGCQRPVCSRERAADGHAETGRDGSIGEHREPHRACIGHDRAAHEAPTWRRRPEEAVPAQSVRPLSRSRLSRCREAHESSRSVASARSART
jgi:hypothetical protein